MAGFVLEAVDTRGSAPERLKIVDLGSCETVADADYGRARAAWARWTATRQLELVQDSARLLFIEGQPDRLPNDGEKLEHWLQGRTGSFRGFQIEKGPAPDAPPRLTVFVDPMATRPIYVLAQAGRLCFGDKLSAIVANCRGLECEWGALLENMVVGSMYSSPGTTVRGVEMLLPGEIIETSGAEIVRRRATPVPLGGTSKPDAQAAARLRQALGTAVRETWTDPTCSLLLSGGLDSRLILGLSEGKRRTMSVNLYPHETAIARRVADACGADFEMFPFGPEHYCRLYETAYLVTGAMHQSRFVNHLGMGRRWRDAGVTGVTHGYLHNMMFRGWAAERWLKYPDLQSPLLPYMGRKSYYIGKFGCQSEITMKAALDLLSADGKQVLQKQLSALAESMPYVIVDGFDLTFERRLAGELARQVYYSILLGWLEEIDIQSPVLHEAAWEWYRNSHPADRHNSKCVFETFHSIGRGLAEIPDANTGFPVPRPRSDEEDRRKTALKNQFWFPILRGGIRAVRKRIVKPPAAAAGLNWYSILRQQRIMEALSAGIEAVADHDVFAKGVLRRKLAEYQAGDDSLGQSLWAAATAGQWSAFVANGSASREVIATGADSAAT